VITLVDQDLVRFDRIWAAAGTPNAVFALTYADLLALTGAKAADIAER
jgi:prolyl-tRNA editing enzyme YbaK/EbsC (Cys-tRNA(Pro) deacylase)